MVAVIPNVAGICVWSPPLDEMGNSVRGVAFYKMLTERFNFHVFDNDKPTGGKLNPVMRWVCVLVSECRRSFFFTPSLTAANRSRVREESGRELRGRICCRLSAQAPQAPSQTLLSNSAACLPESACRRLSVPHVATRR